MNKFPNQNTKIDFVIFWVNGADPTWLAKMQKYNKTPSHTTETERFRDWEVLRYWFRSVEKFAPWVNRIYFVSDRQVPAWLNTNHKKLVLVSHEDFVPKDNLPTFNSNTLELSVCNIKSLSEHFVLFNDDMFILKPVEKTDFFYNGLPCDTGIMAPIIPDQNQDFGCTQMNNLSIINENFHKNAQIPSSPFHWFNPKYGIGNLKNLLCLPWHNFPGFYEPHIPESLLKSTCRSIAAQYHSQIQETMQYRFRNYRNNLSEWVYRDWQVASNSFHPRSINFGHSYFLSKDITKIVKIITKQKYKTICINDDDRIKDFDKLKTALDQAFQTILPTKSEYEK